ncbi:helix-hairpin-helix domain-containing protein [Heliophilum fasciatum]|nr:helix-hairpin-helix domain-containing protein [Heliophilum fasciatum]MCW2278114.1 competence protein ComEA [Heliophilum fasciatum]
MDNRKRVFFVLGALLVLVVAVMLFQGTRFSSSSNDLSLADGGKANTLTLGMGERFGGVNRPGESGGGQAPGTGGKEIVVHVLGAVYKPGVYRLPAGSRVEDVLQLASCTEDADLESINRAAPLVDGKQLVILTREEVAQAAVGFAGNGAVAGGQNRWGAGGSVGAGGTSSSAGNGGTGNSGENGGAGGTGGAKSSGSAVPTRAAGATGYTFAAGAATMAATDNGATVQRGGSSGVRSVAAGGGGLIDINQATVAELDQLPGIGPALAERIVQYRESKGGFARPEDLQEVAGIGAKKYADLKDRICVQ